MCANCRSNGAATALAIISGLAPGSIAETLIVGKSTCGKGAVGSCRNATIPASATAAVSNTVAIGRRMNGAEIPSPLLVRAPRRTSPSDWRTGLAFDETEFMPAQPQEDHPCLVPLRASGRTSPPVDQRRGRGLALYTVSAPD